MHRARIMLLSVACMHCARIMLLSVACMHRALLLSVAPHLHVHSAAPRGADSEGSALQKELIKSLVSKACRCPLSLS